MTLDYKRYSPNKLACLYKNKLDEYNIDYEGEFEFIDENIIKLIHACSNSFSIHERADEIEITNNLTNCVNKFESEELLNLMNEISLNDKKVYVYTNSLFNILIDASINEFLKTFEYYIKSKFRLIGRANFIKNLFCGWGLPIRKNIVLFKSEILLFSLIRVILRPLLLQV